MQGRMIANEFYQLYLEVSRFTYHLRLDQNQINVIFENSNLNEITQLVTDVAKNIGMTDQYPALNLLTIAKLSPLGKIQGHSFFHKNPFLEQIKICEKEILGVPQTHVDPKKSKSHKHKFPFSNAIRTTNTAVNVGTHASHYAGGTGASLVSSAVDKVSTVASAAGHALSAFTF